MLLYGPEKNLSGGHCFDLKEKCLREDGSTPTLVRTKGTGQKERAGIYNETAYSAHLY